MTQNRNREHAFNFYRRYSGFFTTIFTEGIFERIQKARKFAGPVFEKFLVELKKKIDSPSMDICYAISNDEYHDIKEYMLNINSV